MYIVSYGQRGYLPSIQHAVDTLAEAKQCLSEERIYSLECYNGLNEIVATFSVWTALGNIKAQELKETPGYGLTYGIIEFPDMNRIDEYISICYVIDDADDYNV